MISISAQRAAFGKRTGVSTTWIGCVAAGVLAFSTNATAGELRGTLRATGGGPVVKARIVERAGEIRQVEFDLKNLTVPGYNPYVFPEGSMESEGQPGNRFVRLVNGRVFVALDIRLKGIRISQKLGRGGKPFGTARAIVRNQSNAVWDDVENFFVPLGGGTSVLIEEDITPGSRGGTSRSVGETRLSITQNADIVTLRGFLKNRFIALSDPGNFTFEIERRDDTRYDVKLTLSINVMLSDTTTGRKVEVSGVLRGRLD